MDRKQYYWKGGGEQCKRDGRWNIPEHGMCEHCGQPGSWSYCLGKEMERYRYDFLGISEMRWIGTGELNGAELIWSGEEKEHVRRVGFLLNETARRTLLGYRPVSLKKMVARSGLFTLL